MNHVSPQAPLLIYPTCSPYVHSSPALCSISVFVFAIKMGITGHPSNLFSLFIYQTQITRSEKWHICYYLHPLCICNALPPWSFCRCWYYMMWGAAIKRVGRRLSSVLQPSAVFNNTSISLGTKTLLNLRTLAIFVKVNKYTHSILHASCILYVVFWFHCSDPWVAKLWNQTGVISQSSVSVAIKPSCRQRIDISLCAVSLNIFLF